MNASEVCKQSGLSGVEELARMSNISRQTLYNWSRERPEAFALMVLGASELKRNVERNRLINQTILSTL